MKKEFETPKFDLNLFVDDIQADSGVSNPGNTGEWGGNENVPGNGTEGWV